MWALIVAYEGKSWSRIPGEYDFLISQRDYLWRTSKAEIKWTVISRSRDAWEFSGGTGRARSRAGGRETTVASNGGRIAS